ncbi:MAG: uracil-DNA glycosylase, partial [Candidatus Cloacimonadota bacterium]|nr:uracil-DNA glycosylase [Candidatus Cloacimonadota bacterium]
CRLHQTRTQSIVGEGNLSARTMLIAQAPGEVEDKQGCMFVGPSGKILNELFSFAKINRSDIYITNLLKCMLPNCRKPKQDEIQLCSYFLDMEIEFINPEILVPLGFYATNYIFEKYFFPRIAKSDFAEYVGKLFSVGKKQIFPLTHPAAIIYNKSLLEPTKQSYRKLGELIQDKYKNIQ